MTNVAYDARWKGAFGISRYSREVRSRLSSPTITDLTADLNPFSLNGLASWEATTGRHWVTHRRGTILLSPSFTPSVAWRGLQAITVHDLIHLDVPAESNRFKNLYYNGVVRPAIRKNAVTFTVSQYSQQRICEWADVSPDRVVVTGNAAAPEFNPDGPAWSPGYPYILYIRNAKPHKNSAALVEAFALLDAPEYKLVLSGNPDDACVTTAARLGVTDRVIFAGRIPEEQLADYYRGADIAAFPSLYEGFGIPAVEAMACGTPVVASNTTSLPEVVGTTGVLVDPHDVSDIAAGLAEVLNDETLRARLRREGPIRAAHFSWDDIAETVQATINCIR